MQRPLLIAVAAIALGAPFTPAASAGDSYRDEDRRYYDGDRRHDHDDRRHEREDLYVVHIHLDGGSRQVEAKSQDRAERIEELLLSVGANAHIDGSRVVHYSMRGNRKVIRRSHEDAHRLAQKLEGYGFHAHVDHE